MKQEELLVIKSHQRAMLAGLVAGLLESDDDFDLADLKLHIAECWGMIMGIGMVVGDEIDAHIGRLSITVLEQEKALAEAADLLK